jgi:phosphoglycerate dehydrogenase-like enzyme
MNDRPPSHPLRVVLGEWQTETAFHETLTAPVTLIPAASVQDADIAPLLGDADALLCRRFTAGMAANAPRLRLILTPGAGTNEIDFDAVPDGAAVCNVYGHEHAIAEYAFMTMLALNRDLLNMDRRFRTGDWQDRANGPQRELRGTTLGIVGLGRIGAEVARRATVFGMRVIAATRSPESTRHAALGLDRVTGMEALHEVLAESDFVVIAVPLQDDTIGLIDAAALRAMKPGAFLVNVARGPVIDEDALYEALRDRAIGGAALDVWYRYPDNKVSGRASTRPFHELDNVIVTPHIAGWTEGTFRHRWEAIDDNLRRLATGEPLVNVVRG